MIKTVVTVILALAFVTGSEITAAAKLAEKLSNNSVIGYIKNKDCEAGAARLCPVLA